MYLRLIAIEAACRSELAAGNRFPSKTLRVLAESADLRSDTLEGLRIEAKKTLVAALPLALA